MKNIQTYCNNIYLLIKEYGEEYINHFRWELTSEDKFLGENLKDNVSTEKTEHFVGNIHLANELGQICDNYREECISGIKDKLLEIYKTKQNSYAKSLLEKMWYIQLNQPIGKTLTFKNKIIPEVFIPIIKLLIDEGININKILSDYRKNKGDGFCSWITLKEEQKSDKPIHNTEKEFCNLFKVEYRKYITQFNARLEENGITKNGIYIHQKKNYLAKLYVYLQSKGILSYQKIIPQITIFYQYFGLTVCEKADNKRTNTVTIRNLTKVCNTGLEGLLETEKNQFNLICSVFISEQK